MNFPRELEKQLSRSADTFFGHVSGCPICKPARATSTGRGECPIGRVLHAAWIALYDLRHEEALGMPPAPVLKSTAA